MDVIKDKYFLFDVFEGVSTGGIIRKLRLPIVQFD